MVGAIIGDTVGSRFEFNNLRSKEFEFLTADCFPTDDSIMTIALADAIMAWDDIGGREKHDYKTLSDISCVSMRKWGLKHPYAGYGSSFRQWLKNPKMGPYNSCGNGSAMRVSPVGWASSSLEECIAMSRAVTEVTHNHPDGIKGAEATAVQVFLARGGASLKNLEEYERKNYYPLEHDLAWLRKNYKWCSVCDGTCQSAFTCLYESTGFEDSIRNCIAVGGDCDTTGAICGAIAEAYWGVDDALRNEIFRFLDNDEKRVVLEFEKRYPKAVS